MFCIMDFLKGVLKNFAKFTGNLKCQSLIRNNVAGCCFCSLSGIYKDGIITHNPANLLSNSFLFCFLWQCSDLSLKILYCTYIVLISEVYSEPYQTSKMEFFSKIVNGLKLVLLEKTLGGYKCKFLFGKSLLLNRNKMMNASISSPPLFLFFFQQTDSLKSCIMQPQLYLRI